MSWSEGWSEATAKAPTTFLHNEQPSAHRRFGGRDDGGEVGWGEGRDRGEWA